MLLHTGEEMVRQEPVGVPLSHIKVSEVARHAGLTHGAVYYHWDSQDDYRTALTSFILERRGNALKDSWNVAMEAAQRGVPFEDVVFAGAREAFEALRDSPYLALQLGVWGHRHRDVELRQLLMAMYRRSEDAITPLFRAILFACNRELREPYTYDLLAALMTAALEGVVVRSGVDPETVTVPQREEDPSYAFALMLMALLEAATKPSGEAD